LIIIIHQTAILIKLSFESSRSDMFLLLLLCLFYTCVCVCVCVELVYTSIFYRTVFLQFIFFYRNGRSLTVILNLAYANLMTHFMRVYINISLCVQCSAVQCSFLLCMYVYLCVCKNEQKKRNPVFLLLLLLLLMTNEQYLYVYIWFNVYFYPNFK
jgi:hypothetical protein